MLDSDNCLVKIMVLDDFATSDHLPLCMELDVEYVPSCEEKDSAFAQTIDWAKLENSDLKRYNNQIGKLLAMIPFNFELLNCKKCKYKDEMYSLITDSLDMANRDLLCERHISIKTYQIGMNISKEVHSNARICFYCLGWLH